jgi:hypothetical protein
MHLLFFNSPLWREDGSLIYLYNCFWTFPWQSLLGRSPAELTAIFYCLIWDSPNLEGQVPVFISPRNRVAQLYPWALGSLFVASYDSQGSGGGILTRLHTGQFIQSRSHSTTNNQSVLVSGAHLGPATIFSVSFRFSFRQLRFVIL